MKDPRNQIDHLYSLVEQIRKDIGELDGRLVKVEGDPDLRDKRRIEMRLRIIEGVLDILLDEARARKATLPL